MLKADDIRQYFNDESEIVDLVDAIEIALESEEVFHYQFINMDDVHYVSRQDLLKLCQEVVNHQLNPEYLTLIAKTLQESEHFELGEDDVIAEICYCWIYPEENQDLTVQTIQEHSRILEGLEEIPV